MNTPLDADSDSVLPPQTPPAPSRELAPDDEFEGEELGERQAEACSHDEGCTWCQ